MQDFSSKNILIAGRTGSGRSKFTDYLITTFIVDKNPAKFKLILLDPKRVHLAGYNGLPHFLFDVAVSIDEAKKVFDWALSESLRRLQLIGNEPEASIFNYNKNSDASAQLPEITIILDEAADYMVIDRELFEGYIKQITSQSNKTGIYIINSTSRPSAEMVITEEVNKCFTDRICFSVVEPGESILIIGEEGAEKLNSPGSAILKGFGLNEIVRIQMPYVSDDEITNIINSLKK